MIQALILQRQTSSTVATTVPVWNDSTRKRGAMPVSPTLQADALPLNHRGVFSKESRHVITVCVMGVGEGGEGVGGGGTWESLTGGLTIQGSHYSASLE